MGLFDKLIAIAAPKKKPPSGGALITPDFNPITRDRVLALPAYTAFRDDILSSRQSGDSRVLLKTLFRQDPDISATVNGYLTMANTEMLVWAEDIDGNIDPEASASLHQLIKKLTRQVDYTLGFQFKQSLEQMNADQRYMMLLRGGTSVELVLDKQGLPDSLRMVDLSTIQFYEKNPGEYKPAQLIPGQGVPVVIDQPTLFISFYRRDPTSIYSDSTFVAAINTIAARQQVINDLYRIMQQTGYPRLEITVLEDVIRNNAPADVKADAAKMAEYVSANIQAVSSTFANIRADQAIAHSDALTFKIMNEKNPSVGIDISGVINTLNAQNQAGLKTMATVIGRGENGVNTGSVEARLAAMYADELNKPLEEIYSRMFSFCLHQQGYQGFANVKFRPAELRPATELEPQLVMKAQRLRQDLSDGIISDAEYTLQMYGRLPAADAPVLSGSGFVTPPPAGGTGASAHPSDISTKEGPLNRAISPDKTKQPKANPKGVAKK